MKKIVSLFLAVCMMAGVACMGAVQPYAAGEDISASFTDPVFRAAVYEALEITPGDPITAEKCTTIKGLYLNEVDIKDLAGIEHFTNLISLTCSNGQLSHLDISKNAALDYLCVQNNHLTKLDVTNNHLLSVLNCGENKLTELDVTQNAKLEIFMCFTNELSFLDLSGNPKLNWLDVRWNHLSSLSKITGLASLELEHLFFEPQYGRPAVSPPKWSDEWFATTDEAALDFSLTYMAVTLTEGIELGTTIYRKFNWRTFKMGYGYASPRVGTETSVFLMPPLRIFLCPLLYAANIHTHPPRSSANFSGQDMSVIQRFSWIPIIECVYVVGPEGRLRRYDWKTKENEIIYNNLDFFARHE